MRRLLLAALMVAPAGAYAAEPSAPNTAQMLSLSAVEALVAIDEQRLSGVFSFVAEKDGPAAFADLIAHSKKALKKFVAKAEKDKKIAGGISSWDRDALQYALGIYDSPLASTLEPLDAKLRGEIMGLINGQVLMLEQISAARLKGKP